MGRFCRVLALPILLGWLAHSGSNQGKGAVVEGSTAKAIPCT